MTEQSLYDAVAIEIERRQLNPELWARALAESDGSDVRARTLYIGLRVEQLRNAPAEQRAARSRELWESCGRRAGHAWAKLRTKLSRLFVL
jgi:hypothetical protein